MDNELPRIEAVTVDGPSTLHVRWRRKRTEDTVNLIGWIVTGGDILARLLMGRFSGARRFRTMAPPSPGMTGRAIFQSMRCT
jgi:hypothetical protein